jgi:hypothetical protein
MKSKLLPLDLKEEIEKYEAKGEKKEINFGKCKHKDATVKNGMLVCPCGSCWSGARINELFDFFKKRK